MKCNEGLSLKEIIRINNNDLTLEDNNPTVAQLSVSTRVPSNYIYFHTKHSHNILVVTVTLIAV